MEYSIDWRQEEWKDIQGYEGRYQISTFGRVKSVRRDLIMMCEPYSEYASVQLYDGVSKQPKSKLVHRLVAEAFIPNHDPEHLHDINHIDSFKRNNVVDNLEWTNKSYNAIHHNATAYSRVLNHVWMQNDCELKLIHIKDVKEFLSQGFIYSNETGESLHHDDEYKKWMSKRCKGIKKCDHMRKALSASTQGRYKGWKWIYKGDVRTRVSPKEGERLVSNEGWKYGRDGHGTR